MSARIVMTTALTIVAGLVTASAAGVGGGVSPGEPDRFAVVEARCPTFSWEASPGADAFELVAFALPPGLEPNQVADEHLTAETAALYARVPGGATGWTPSADQCLAPGGRYVWFVRSVAAEEPSPWSEGRHFAVPAGPTVEELARAVDVIRQWEAANGGGSLPLSAGAAPAAAAESGVRKGSTHPKSVPTAVASVRGDSVDTVGELYGVVGTSASISGAGVGAANTAGGPDLVLDGSANGEADTLISESGISRASAGAEVFSVRNSGGGTIVLDVEGTLEANALDCPGCVTSTALAGSAVTAAKIAAGAVGGSAIHGNAVTSTHIADGAVTSADILDGTITAADVNPTSSIYVLKGQLYERVESASLDFVGGVVVVVSCDDANDLPVAGSCHTSASNMRLYATEAIYWSSSTFPAAWECRHYNTTGGMYTGYAKILCISVP